MIDTEKLVLIRRRRVYHYYERGAYQIGLPTEWCREHQVQNKDPVAIYQVIGKPDTLVVRFEPDPNDS